MTHQLSVFGLGKLGLPLTALFARSGVKTIGIDINPTLIARLKAGETPYVEPGLAGLLEEVAPTITYTTEAQAAAATDASIILVPTPSDPSAPEFSIEYVVAACNDLAAAPPNRRRGHAARFAPACITGRYVAKGEGTQRRQQRLRR